MNRPLFGGTLLILSFLLSIVHGSSAQTVRQISEPTSEDFRGGLVSPPLPKPKFTLTDTNGTPFDFGAKTQGYVTLLFFGYTHCPDMCPLQMSFIAQSFKKMPEGFADQFKVVFV